MRISSRLCWVAAWTPGILLAAAVTHLPRSSACLNQHLSCVTVVCLCCAVLCSLPEEVRNAMVGILTGEAGTNSVPDISLSWDSSSNRAALHCSDCCIRLVRYRPVC